MSIDSCKSYILFGALICIQCVIVKYMLVLSCSQNHEKFENLTIKLYPFRSHLRVLGTMHFYDKETRITKYLWQKLQVTNEPNGVDEDPNIMRDVLSLVI